MRISVLVFITLLAATSVATSQSLPIFRDATRPPILDAIPDDAGLVSVDRALLEGLDIATLDDVVIPRFHLPGHGRRNLLLRRFDLLAPTAILVEGRRDGDRPMTVDRHMMLTGSVEGIPGSFVYMAIFPGYASGFIELPKGGGGAYPERFLLAPDNAERIDPVTIVYASSDTLLSGGGGARCGVEEISRYLTPGWGEFIARRSGAKEARDLADRQMLAVQIAIECDSLYYLARGRNLSISANYALAVMGASSAIYQRDISIMIQVPYLRIWTTSDNPYPGPGDGDLLSQLRDHWNTRMGEIRRSGVIAYSKFRGGLAYVGALCGEYGYAMAGIAGNTNFPAANYTWDIDVTSHELGHNLGSPHTHSCTWAPAIDSCWDSEGGCFSAKKPRPGWIMSYCHLNAGTRLFFHPRVATLIRSWAEGASCITPTPHPAPVDLASVDIVIPSNGGRVKTRTSFTPTAMIRNIGSTGRSGAQVTFTITTADSTQIYTGTVAAPTLAPGASATLPFPAASIVDPGLYAASVVIDITGDTSLYNNRLTRPFLAVSLDTAGTLALGYPNGGETLIAGDSVTITWSGTGVAEATLDLSTDGGAGWSTIRWSTPAGPGAYRWKVPPTPTGEALVRVGDRGNASVNDRSNTTFTIAVNRDVQPIEFALPAGNDSIEAPVTPRLLVRNNGSQPATNVPVRFRMEWRPGGLPIYDTAIIVPSIPATSTIEVLFPATGDLPDGPFNMIARTSLPGDLNISNDSIGRSSANTRGISPPSLIDAEGICDAAIVRWSPSRTPGVDRYVILRGANPTALLPIDTLRPTVVTWVDESVANDVPVYYAVVSLRRDTSSIPSRVVQARPACFVAGDSMRAPRLILPRYDARDIPLPIHLIWEATAAAERYQVELSYDAGFTDLIASWVVRDPTPITAGATFDASYYWRVRAINNTLLGPWSAPHPFSTASSCASGGLRFNGGDSYALDTGIVWNGGAVTVEFWNLVRSDEVTTGSVFAVGGGDVIDQRFQAHVPWSNGVLYWDYGNISDGSGRVTVDYTPYLDQWTHVALVYDGARERTIYLNGRRVARANGDSLAVRSLAWLRLGGTGPGSNHRHKGAIDEFRIWRRSRSEEEIRLHMAQRVDASSEPDLFAYYRMDEGSGMTTANAVGGTARLYGGVSWENSDAPINCDPLSRLAPPLLLSPAADTLLPVSTSTPFDWEDVAGANGYQVEIAEDENFLNGVVHVDGLRESRLLRGALAPEKTWFWRARALADGAEGLWSEGRRFTTSTACQGDGLILDSASGIISVPSFSWRGREVTVEYWAYIDSADVRDSWMFWVGEGDSTHRLSAHAPWGDRMIYFDFGDYGNLGRLTASYANHLNRWTHVALVSNGRDFKAIYLDGELAASDGIADRTEVRTGGLRIGGGHNGLPVKGRITEFRIWNTARDQDRIRASMYRRFSGPQSGLVGYWRCDVVDTLLRDASGFANNGAVPDSAHWTRAILPISPIIPSILGPGRALKNGEAVYRLSDPVDGIRWNVDGGLVATGQGTSVVTVRWGPTENGRIVVTGTTADGCVVASVLDVDLRETLGAPIVDESTLASMKIEPNPTRGASQLQIDLRRNATLRVDLYDARGVLVGFVAERSLDAGRHVIALPTETLASGPLFCVIRVDGQGVAMPMIVVR